ncbi:hypothetical protein [Algoriphagus machipongonensis]|uniref:Uncharacterized protein n=1 Tax=Algoriphagus machipongonensis TaxID=388413 RepID=A3I011_9BACT|nr:hypothetical protein [Algoriphagus machipongonensis]EAZ80847.2 hypothetical protein ALPR1_07975 [Algoriphagus machipongonensis]
MKFFYISSIPNDNGKFEIHERECEMIPDLHDREYLGPYNNGKEAMRKALDLNSNASLCRKCGSSSFQAIFSGSED